MNNSNNSWLMPSVIYLTKHGSQAYGLNNELSDVDVKGICVPPIEVENNLFHRFEQAENNAEIEAQFGWLRNPQNPKFESSVYSLRKFMVLAANVNPNIVELLWTDDGDRFVCEPAAVKLLQNRDMFLSSKAKFTFSGYAFAQAAKIERHRKWIVQGELEEPSREKFGLPIMRPRNLEQIFGYIKSEVERWNLTQYGLDNMAANDLKETIWELVLNVSQIDVNWDNWPQAYEAGVIKKLAAEFNLSDEVVDLLNREVQYKKASVNYKSWLRWKAERNPARRELELKSGYDTKHASHLVRLMRMGYEILTEGKVIVKRPDREEILGVKNGAWSYEQVMDFAKDMQQKLDEAYSKTKLPKSVNFEKVNALYHEIYNGYHSQG